MSTFVLVLNILNEVEQFNHNVNMMVLGGEMFLEKKEVNQIAISFIVR